MIRVAPRVLAVGVAAIGITCMAVEVPDRSGDRFLLSNVVREAEEDLDGQLAAQLRALGDAAHAGQWRRLELQAKDAGQRLVAAGHRSPPTYAVVTAYRAAAAAALGRETDARWYWHATLNLWPDVDRAKLVELLDLPRSFVTLDLPRFIEDTTCAEGQLRAKHRRVDSRLLIALEGLREVNTFSAQGIVGADGRCHSPRLYYPAQALGGDAAYAGLEAMKDMEFVVPPSKTGFVECPFAIMGVLPRRE